MTRENEENLALHSLDCLSDEESRALTSLLETSPDLRDEAASLASVVDALGDLAGEASPPPHLKDRLLTTIRANPKPQVTLPSRDKGEIAIVKADERPWEATAIEGIFSKVLMVHKARKRVTFLLRMEAGRVFPAHTHAEMEESLLIDGDLSVGDLTMSPGDFQVAQAGTHHGPQVSRGGCIVMVNVSLDDEVLKLMAAA